MPKAPQCMVCPACLLPVIAAVVCLLVPSQSSAFIPLDLPGLSSFATDREICRNDPIDNTDPLGLAPGEGGNPITIGPDFDFYPRGGWVSGQFDFEHRTMSGFKVVDKATKPLTTMGFPKTS